MGAEALEKSGDKKIEWVIIGPDTIPRQHTGAYDLASFLKRKLALAVSLRSA